MVRHTFVSVLSIKPHFFLPRVIVAIAVLHVLLLIEQRHLIPF
jgi:hypothetical protein